MRSGIGKHGLKSGVFALACLTSVGVGGENFGYSNLFSRDIAGPTGGMDITGTPNQVVVISMWPNTHITGVGFDVTLETFDPSWASEAQIHFYSSSDPIGVTIAPGFATSAPLPNATNFSSGGIIDLPALNLDFFLGSDGLLFIENTESWDDQGVDPDGWWLPGSWVYIGGFLGGPACPEDTAPPGGNGVVNIDDLVVVLNGFGPCPGTPGSPDPPGPCPGDVVPGWGNGVVNIDDLVAVLNGFGDCPGF